jgi:hypothetical protein
MDMITLSTTLFLVDIPADSDLPSDSTLPICQVALGKSPLASDCYSDICYQVTQERMASLYLQLQLQLKQLTPQPIKNKGNVFSEVA